MPVMGAKESSLPLRHKIYTFFSLIPDMNKKNRIEISISLNGAKTVHVIRYPLQFIPFRWTNEV